MRRTSVAFLAGVAGLATVSGAAVNTSIVWQVSRDGFNWTSSLGGVPGGTVYARALLSYTGTAQPLGLASMSFQPTVSNWTPGNELLPFVNGGVGGNTTTPVGVVTDPFSTTSFGRLSPWGRTAMNVTNFLRGHAHSGGSNWAPAGNWLRIAQNTATSWFGGAGNTTGGQGVPISQLNDSGRTAGDPAFVNALQDIVVFKFAFTLSTADFGNLVWVVDSPASSMGNYNSTTGEREVYWFASMTEATGSIRGTATVSAASVFVPSPSGVVAMLGGFGVLGIRRVRRR